MMAATRTLGIFILFSICIQLGSAFTCYNQTNVTSTKGAKTTYGNKACAVVATVCGGVASGVDCLGLSSKSMCGTTSAVASANSSSSCTATYKCCYADLCNTYNAANTTLFGNATIGMWLALCLWLAFLN